MMHQEAAFIYSVPIRFDIANFHDQFFDTTEEREQNLQTLWIWSFTLSTQPVATTIQVTFTARTVAFDVLPSLLNVCISVASATL